MEAKRMKLKGSRRVTNSEKTAPMDMLRTKSSSSSVSDDVIFAEQRTNRVEGKQQSRTIRRLFFTVV